MTRQGARAPGAPTPGAPTAGGPPATRTGVPDDDALDLPAERDAVVGSAGTRRRRHRGERLTVPGAEFRSYYGMPVLHAPTWKAHDIAGYLFLGGLAGVSSALAAGAELTGRPHLARAGTVGAAGALAGSLYALIHDLGRPARFVNMLRVVKVTSPMNLGSWLLTAYGPQAVLAAGSAVTGRFRRTGRVATVGAGLLGPAVATYTAALISDTAVPVWHDGYREMPFLFAGSAATAAGGLGVLTAPAHEAGPARRAALAGAVAELAATRLMERRLGPLVAGPLRRGPSGRLVRFGGLLGLAGAVTANTAGRRSRWAAAGSGLALVAASVLTRFGIFQAGVASSLDPEHTVRPQRDRLTAREEAAGAHEGP